MSARPLTILFVALVITVCGGGVVYANHETHHAACTVTGKDRAKNGDGSSDMRLYTSCGTFAVGDGLPRSQFDSADLYGSIREGQTYDLAAIGWRIPFLSVFPVIVEAKEADRG